MKREQVEVILLSLQHIESATLKMPCVLTQALWSAQINFVLLNQFCTYFLPGAHRSNILTERDFFPLWVIMNS